MKIPYFFMLFLFTVSFAFAAEEGLVGYWNFDEGKGDIAGDSSANKNDGKLIRNPEWVDGKFGKALKFDGAKTQKVEIPHSDSFTEIATAVTIEAWINPANFSAWMSFGVKGDITYGMFINPDAYVRMHYSGGSTLDTPAKSIKANEWTHVAATYNGKKVQIYLNGKAQAELATNTAIPANTATFVIGGTQESRDWFSGMIDEVKLYSRGLTEDEVKKSMAGSQNAVTIQEKITSTWGKIKDE